MTQDGQAYELLTLAHPITVSESLSSPIPEDSMLRTPSAIEGQGGAITEKQSRERGRMLQVRDQMAQLAAENGLKVSDGIADSLLPTVKARDSSPEGYEAGLRRGMPQLGTMVKAIVDGDDRLDLLPTPIVRDYKDGSAAQERDGKVSTDTVARAIFNSGEVLLGTPRTSAANSPSSKEVQNGAEKARLEDQVKSANEGYISWGKFEPAIHRWEQVLGRDAPAPTKPDGKDGNHRLAAEFTEWMMGLPAGHVTDPSLGLTRVEMLKLCGNGVVPQQAKLALQILLDGVDW
jgi:DNA (cytosine-5)-methyltransferase 1